MKYLSVCSGIEAATVAWQPLGWSAVGFSEIEKFPSAVLQHYYPDVPNFGDMNDFRNWSSADIDVLVGGTPCQSFSVAGLRKGMADPRGNLALTYVAIVERYSPNIVVWENVPGCLSSNEGRDFGSIIGAMVELGYGVAYRVLDAQYFGVPQRRRRVFVVGCAGNWRRAAEILFEPESLRRNPPPSRKKGQKVAGTLEARSKGGGGVSTDMAASNHVIPSHDPAMTLTAREYKGALPEADLSTVVAHSLRGEGFDASEDGTGRGTPLIASPLTAGSGGAGRRREDDHNLVPYNITPSNSNKDFNAREAEYAQAVTTGGGRPSARGGDIVAFAQNQRDEVRLMDKAGALAAEPGAKQQTYVFKAGQGSDAGSIGGDENVSPTLGAAESGSNRTPTLMHGMAVRRLTPLECERLQGFPDGYTDIPGASDSVRYKALGNSMAVPVMHWIGKRISTVINKPTRGFDV